MYRLELFINAYRKSDLISHLEDLLEDLKSGKIFSHASDELSNEYRSYTVYRIKDEYDFDKEVENAIMAGKIPYDDEEMAKEYWFLVTVLGYSEEEAKKEIEERF